MTSRMPGWRGRLLAMQWLVSPRHRTRLLLPLLALRARVEALNTSLAPPNTALQEALTSQTVTETGRLSAEMAIGSFRSDVNGITGRM